MGCDVTLDAGLTSHVVPSPVDSAVGEILVKQSLLDDTSISSDPNTMCTNRYSVSQQPTVVPGHEGVGD